ncbi:hypothetical protein ACSN7D_000173 [Flavobacterium psychrophilum]|uniref:hypothetical protein n=1 Tax=Flavobacterium psychrophilum TaxID=96345 RepID=UPI001C8F3997|nr:hypothetical protein [Flavobacterium psychrophilum]EKT3972903.1 hypothetical protein [Flavobacterium psychrophilum]EKT4499566.1 hypothetical protein [Flavobacterium psychrophilum]EKT4519246.1 hypothetical protein [Flavobacterium psychrophilum]EKT4535630.1 hypothetical protein [Flavobacterium psychrophilum]EKT4569982.1 hypothetical protein [Flavobacterium psychrophilum]
MELDFKIIIPLISILIGTVVAFYKMKNEYDKELRKFDKELNEKIHKLEIELEKLKGRDENQQQIINSFQTQVLDHLPKIYDLINSQKKIK